MATTRHDTKGSRVTVIAAIAANGAIAVVTNDILARAVVFGVVILIIVIRPQGLFSYKGR